MERSQMFVKLLDGRTQCFQIPSATVSGETLKQQLFATTGIPLCFQRLVSGSREIQDETLISVSENGFFPSCSLLLRLRGGKGGFGSLLRGAATKAGQKKTNNFDACRDMSGRRLRHVNAEKRLEEWTAEAEARKLEKLADQFLKKKTKEVKKSSSAAAEKYMEKYRADSARCTEEVEESVRQSFELYEKSKRKALPSSGPASKRLHIWMGKKKVDESESEDEEEDEGADKSVILNGGSKNDEEATPSSDRSDQESSDGGSGKSNLEEEDSASNQNGVAAGEPEKTIVEEDGMQPTTTQDSDGDHLEEEPVVVQTEQQIDSEGRTDSSPEVEICNAAAEMIEGQSSKEPLNFEAFNSAEELEVLGMEALKSELQTRGLKCGGTLRERAARLFLLKSTPLEKLPKKLLAKPLK